MQIHTDAQMPRFSRWACTAVALLVALVGIQGEAFAQYSLSQQGRLLSSGGFAVPDGPHTFVVKFYTVQSGGSAVLTYTVPSVSVTKGVFTVPMNISAADLTTFATSLPTWVGVTLDTDSELPRIPLRDVPFALSARQAFSLTCSGCVTGAHIQDGAIGNVEFNAATIFDAITPGSGATGTAFNTTQGNNVLKFAAGSNATIAIDSVNHVVTIGATTQGTVTSVATGAGLTGGPINGASPSGTIAIATAGVLNSMIANDYVTVSPGTGVSVSGNYPAGTPNTSGKVALGTTVTVNNTGTLSVGAVAPLASSGGQNPSISIAAGGTQQVLKYNGTNWASAFVDAGELTGVLTIAKGGTGMTAAPTAAGQFLRSTGAGTWAVGTIAAGDIAANALNGTYVDLTTAQTAGGAKTWSGLGSFAAGILLNNAVSNKISFGIGGVSQPATTTASGTKVLLSPAADGSSLVDYAVGIEAGALWYSVPAHNAAYAHKFYGGTSEVMRIQGDGTVIVNPSGAAKVTISGGNVTATGIFSGDGSGLTNLPGGGSLSGDVTGPTGTNTVVALRGRQLATTVPVAGQVLTWDGSTWSPGTGGGSGSALNPANLTGPVPINKGGTNGTATPTMGGIAYGDGSTYQFSGAGSIGQVLTSNGLGTPYWTTAAVGSVIAVGTGTGLLGGTITSAGILSVDTAWFDARYVNENQALSIATGMLQDLAVTTTKIADASVTTQKLADAAVTTVKLADNGVTTAKILDAAVTTTKLANNGVTSAKILDGTVAAADVDPTQIQLRVTGTCPQSQVITQIKADGSVVCGNTFLVSNTAPKPCDATQFGYTYASQQDQVLYVCNGTKYVPIALGPVAPTSYVGTSCEDILAKYPTSQDGVYSLTDGTTTYQTWCDMTTGGGGWTMVFNLNTSDGTIRHYDDTTFWTTATTTGSAANAFIADYKSAAFSKLPARQLMVKAHTNGVALGTATYNLIAPADNNAMLTILSSFTNTTMTTMRLSATGTVGTGGNARTIGDSFIDNTYPIIVNSTYSPADSTNNARFGVNYADKCSIVNCNGHQFGGIGGKHIRASAGWGGIYEGAKINGYCPQIGLYGTDSGGMAAYGNSISSTCSPTTTSPVSIAFFIRTQQGSPATTGPLDGSSQTQPAQSCYTLHQNFPSQPDGIYWIDPNGGAPSDAYQVLCNMSRDGGGWTMGVKNWASSGCTGMAGAVGAITDANGNQGNCYKLSDTDINLIGGPKYDIMADQNGFARTYSAGNYEYAVIRGYTGAFTWAGPVPASTTPTTIGSYRIADGALAWQGNLTCGAVGSFGINCDGVATGSGNPAGGSGCAINMGLQANTGWNSIHMARADGSLDTYIYLCNGAQFSSSTATYGPVTHRFWFRPYAGMPKNDGTGALINPAATYPTDCLAILTANPSAPSGTYTIDPDGVGGGNAYPVLCDMKRQGGGWTLGVKHYYSDGMNGTTGAVGSVSDANLIYKNPYKIPDLDINRVIAQSGSGTTGGTFDVMIDQVGYNTTMSTGNFEYLVMRNYTATWTFGSQVAPSSTTTSVQSYRASDDALAWQGNYVCGNVNGSFGINCTDSGATNPSTGTVPGGGIGCDINMGTSSNAALKDFYMADTNGDSRFYVCNGQQYSSQGTVSHRYWFRKGQPFTTGTVPTGVNGTGSYAAPSTLPRSCLAIKQANANAPSGTYYIQTAVGQPAQAVQCEMTRQGGGWTLGVKHWYQDGMGSNAGAVNAVGDGMTTRIYPYKLSDADIKLIATTNFDVMFDEVGANYASGPNEYALIRNYTGTWSWTSYMPASSSTTSVQVYRVSDNALMWYGNMVCGVAGALGINCNAVTAGTMPAPSGGMGCASDLSNGTVSTTYHHLYMYETNSDSYMYMCNGPEASSNNGGMNHRFWFRQAQAFTQAVPNPVGTMITTGVPASCLAIKQAYPSAPDGMYWITPNGSGLATAAQPVQCNMTRQGGGWTLGMKHWYQDSIGATAASVNALGDAMVYARVSPYKLSDADINSIIGGGHNFDVMFDEWGVNYGAAASEYAVIFNYTGTWSWTALMGASTTTTLVQDFRVSDNALAWTGNFTCGGVGSLGVNCLNLSNGVAPGGGMGCDIDMSNGTWSTGYHHLYMYDTNSDSYMYMCNGPEASSNNGGMSHRFWFRQAQITGTQPTATPSWTGIPDANVPGATPPNLTTSTGSAPSTNLPKSCNEILTNNPSAGNGTYWIDPNGGSATDAYQVLCNMTVDGGGWTLGMKLRYQGGGNYSTAAAINNFSSATTQNGNNYKLSDADINTITGGGYFDVMADQLGTLGGGSTYNGANNEYITVHSYPGPWNFAAKMQNSDATTSFQSYRTQDNALAWTGQLNCAVGAAGWGGIQCMGGATLPTPQVAFPSGGPGCAINIGGAGPTYSWANFAMMGGTNNNGDNYIHMCNGGQSSSGGINMRYWFRPAKTWTGVPRYDGQKVTSGLPKDCLAIKTANPGATDGMYWIDPNGGSAIDATYAMCNMSHQGGGWTLGIKHFYQDGIDGANSAVAANANTWNGGAIAQSGRDYAYKLSDTAIGQIVGSNNNYDVMFDQVGFVGLPYGTGNNEYAVIYNYTAPFKFTGLVAPSATTTTVKSYRTADDAVAWSGNLSCGTNNNGAYGIICDNVTGGTDPLEGPGCSINLATYTDLTNGHWLYMSNYNSDTYLYLCNGQQASSTYSTMYHRYWFRTAAAQPAGPPATASGTSAANAAASCAAILANASSSVSGTYWINPTGVGATGAYQVYCDMTVYATYGGGWTMVRSIAPQDGSVLGYNNQNFWSYQAPYGSFGSFATTDYKSPADYQLNGNYIMIQSNDRSTGAVLGWRIWPMNSAGTFGQLFSGGIAPYNGSNACRTAAPTYSSVGSTSTYDDIIRQGGCLHTDMQFGNGTSWDLSRLSAIFVNTDNLMSGFGSCIDCGPTWNSPPYMGIDRAGCNAATCAYNVICRDQTAASTADCTGSYCAGTYGNGVCPTSANTGTLTWNTRIFVK